jgi:hypothetical protein
MIQGSYIAGFVDGEGSFHIAFQRRPDLKFGWQAVPEFHVSQNYGSRRVLEKIRKVLGCGYIKANAAAGKRDKTLVYVVRDRKDLVRKIIPFFRKFPLQTEKRKDFEIFSRIVLFMKKGEHQKLKIFRKIVHDAFSMNAGGRYRRRNKKTILKDLTSSETVRWERRKAKDTVRSLWRHKELDRNIKTPAGVHGGSVLAKSAGK